MPSWAIAGFITDTPSGGWHGQVVLSVGDLRVWAHGHEYTPVPPGTPEPVFAIFRRDAGQGYATLSVA
jgi:hypothetical protein